MCVCAREGMGFLLSLQGKKDIKEKREEIERYPFASSSDVKAKCENEDDFRRKKERKNRYFVPM